MLLLPRTVVAALLLAAAVPAPAVGVQAPHVEVELVAERAAWVPGAANQVALRVAPESGWHTYWRNPGDSGLPTRLEWRLPDGWSAGDILWPYPSAEALGELTNYGYDRETLHLVSLAIPAAVSGGGIAVEATARWLVCKDICIPGQADLSLELPVDASAGTDPRWAAAFADARARLPEAVPVEGGFEIADREFRIELAAGSSRLDGVESAEFFPYANDLVNHGAAQRVVIGRDSVRFAQALSAFHAVPGGAVEGLLVLHGKTTRAWPIRAVPASVVALGAAPAPAPADRAEAPVIEAPSLGIILLFAVLGGLILNLMPCVFPVLAIKAVAVVESHRDERGHALAYAAGVIASCMAAAALIIALRSAGEQLGWGFQLQSPRFVAVLAYVCFALGLSMSGVLEFGTALMGVGESLTQKRGYAGSFFTGVLAVVVASPCTAPFMGTSLGFALTQPAATALLVFAALGFGLALPFLVLGFVPAIGRLLPRPGAWMETFKQLMAFPMYLTVAWLVWVLSRQAGVNAGGVALLGLVLVAFSMWLWARGSNLASRGFAMAALVGAAAVLLLPAMNPSAERPQAVLDEGAQPWSDERVAQLRAEGRSVFAYFTADWCITCKANEKIALETSAVKDAMAAKGVAWLVGDWTNSDPKITEVLTRFGRPGVPLYLLYPPTGEPEVLPQLLTPDIVIEAVERLP